MDLATQADAVRTRQDIVHFLGAMLRDLEYNKEDWENDNLEDFLEALRGCTMDMEGYYKNIGEECPEQPNWNAVANLLVTATVYE